MRSASSALHAGLQSVLDTALDAVVVMDVDGRILGWNEHATASFGWTLAEAVGQKLSDLIIPPQHRPAHERGLKRYLQTGLGPVLNRRIEISALHRDGRELPVELSITESRQFGGRLFIGFIRDIRERQQEVERRHRLLREFNHRVKNMLSVVLAMAHQTARHSSDTESFQEAFLSRLETLAHGHDLLVASEWKEVELQALAEQVLGADAATGRASFSGERALLSANRVLGLALVLHELYTNAVKYGALAVPAGRVDLDWRVEDGEAIVCWRESGNGGVDKPSRLGFGHQMIDMTARADLQGRVDFEWLSSGLVVTIRFPMTA
ncbi:MAG: PAS domain S-box protein [Pseudomonadota bacterium]